jgi:high affinity Mn2+ porin
VDYRLFKHYGDQFELERAYRVMDQPGKVRLLVYRNCAVLTDCNDATVYLIANNPADRQTTFKVRSGEKIKPGVGINLEQAISDELGVSFRGQVAVVGPSQLRLKNCNCKAISSEANVTFKW